MPFDADPEDDTEMAKHLRPVRNPSDPPAAPLTLRQAWSHLGHFERTGLKLFGIALGAIVAIFGAGVGWNQLVMSTAKATDVATLERTKVDKDTLETFRALDTAIHEKHDEAIGDLQVGQARTETKVDLIQQDVRRMADRVGIPAPHPRATPGEVSTP